MKMCTRIEGVRERLWDGSLTLDAAAQLQAAFERRDRFQRRERQRTREARGTGSGSAARTNGSARPAPPRSVQGTPASKLRPGPMLDVSAQKALAVPAERVRPLGEGHWELKAVIDAECERGLEQLRGLLSHIDPRMTLGQLVGRLVKEALDRPRPGPSAAPWTHPNRSHGCRSTDGRGRGTALTGTVRQRTIGPRGTRAPRLRRRRRSDERSPPPSTRRRTGSRARTAMSLRRRSGPPRPAPTTLRRRTRNRIRTVESRR